jgi:hypothetical protein
MASSYSPRLSSKRLLEWLAMSWPPTALSSCSAALSSCSAAFSSSCASSFWDSSDSAAENQVLQLAAVLALPYDAASRFVAILSGTDKQARVTRTGSNSSEIA